MKILVLQELSYYSIKRSRFFSRSRRRFSFIAKVSSSAVGRRIRLLRTKSAEQLRRSRMDEVLQRRVWKKNQVLYVRNLVLGALVSFFTCLPLLLAGQHQPVELGKVQWNRDYDQALELARLSQKPVLILFQEVPGCSTCSNYGKNALSHPFLVEAIEHFFVPLAIHNNKGGKDARILEKYNEPSWNNPVVRIVDHQGKPVIPRLSGNYSMIGLLNSIKNALIKTQNHIPQYFSWLEEELENELVSLRSKTYSMYCFWTGEKTFGELTGVVKTRAGFINGKEVVTVTYNPHKINQSKLDHIAKSNSCQAISTSDPFKNDHIPKYYLSRSEYRYIPMPEVQASRINSALGRKIDPTDLLSPLQKKWLRTLQDSKTSQGQNWIQKDWKQGWIKYQRTL